MPQAALSLEDLVAGTGEGQRRHVRGSGSVEAVDGALHFAVSPAVADTYTNAQVDDCTGRPRRRFPWSAPVRFETRARFSHAIGELRGTAGFGFWNDPFVMTGGRLPTLPRAIWFFYASPPSDLKLDLHEPGHGWKAATIDALHPTAALLVPMAPAATLLMRSGPIRRVLWPKIQRVLRIREAAIEIDMRKWHTYSLEWGRETTSFFVDDEPLLEDVASPRGPLGFIMWLDNQYMVVSPRGRFRWGLLDVPGRQAMCVESLKIATP